MDTAGTEDMSEIRQLLLQKSWFGFDLDDTLHEFRKASKAASHTTLLQMSTKYQVSIDALTASYSKVLQQKAISFTDGKNSDCYRKDRFRTVLEEHSILINDEILDELASTYKTSLEEALELKAGALSLLQYLKSIGKKIVVITEGPQDAQEWTLEKLGLLGIVDFLATSNSFGKSKTAGLFDEVLQRLGIDSRELVFVGDNKQRDVDAAQRCGILAVHYAKKESNILTGDTLRISSLEILEKILRN